MTSGRSGTPVADVQASAPPLRRSPPLASDPQPGPVLLPVSPTRPFIVLHQVSKHYGPTAALTRVDLSLHPGRVTALCGMNGSGKSTLIRLLTGVEAPDPGGWLEVRGQRWPALTPALARNVGVQVIFQDLAVFPNLSVADNVAFDLARQHPLGLRHRARARAIAAAAIERLGGGVDLDATVGSLPIAQRQLVAIARALADTGEVPVRLLILDEPTASLTRVEAERLFEAVRRLQHDQVSILFVSHRFDEVASVADEAVVLRDGHVVSWLSASELSAEALTHAMVGNRPSVSAPRTVVVATDAQVALQACGIQRRGEFGPLDLQLRRGEVVGLVGRLGAGRTELALTLFGLTRPDSGTLRIAGKTVVLRSNRDAIAAGIAYLPEDRQRLGLVLAGSIQDNITLASAGALSNRAGVIDRKRSRQLAQCSVHALGIKAPDVAAAVSTLSGGNQQRVVLAKWLATHPSVLILDAPTVGVDVAARAAIYDAVNRIAAQGVAVLFISDEVEELWTNAHRVIVMSEGKIAANMSPANTSLAALESAVHG